MGFIRRYAASDDPRIALANLTALVLAWNTPFYPLYLIGAGGAAMMPGAWLTLLSFPFFLAIPWLTGRAPVLGRVALLAAGTVNTIWCTWLLGAESGTELFLFPCITLGGLLFARAERFTLIVAMLAPLVLGVAAHGHYPASPFACANAACGSILWMNGLSVAILLVFFGFVGKNLEPVETK